MAEPRTSCPICGAVGCSCNTWEHDPQIGVTRGVVFYREDGTVDTNRVIDRRNYIVQDRFYTDASKERIVAGDSPDAAYLFAAPGAEIPLSEAVAMGIADKDGNPIDPFAESKESSDESKDNGDGQEKKGGPKKVEDKATRGPLQPKRDRRISSLTDVNGIAEATASRLKEAGIESPNDLLAVRLESLVELDIPGMSEAKINDWKRQIEEDIEANGPLSDEDGQDGDNGDGEGDESTTEAEGVEGQSDNAEEDTGKDNEGE